MEPVPEIPMCDNRRSDVSSAGLVQVTKQQSPRQSLLFDEQGRPVLVKSSSRSSASGGDTPTVISDANTLKRKLHNLFLSGASLRGRSSDCSAGSAASASPVSTGSPIEWPSGDSSTPSAASTASSSKRTSREITLEEELQARLSHMTEAMQSWHTKWRQEREETCRLSDNLGRCESESKRILEGLALTYAKKVKILEDTLIRAMKTNEQLMIEKNILESRLKQSKDIIDLQRHEIEQEFARARKDVEQLRIEVGNMQSRKQRLEVENEDLKAEKQLLHNDLQLFTGDSHKLNTTMKATQISCDLYRVIIDIALQKLKLVESIQAGLGSSGQKDERLKGNNRGRFVLRVDDDNPVIMHIEDMHETCKTEKDAASSNVKPGVDTPMVGPAEAINQASEAIESSELPIKDTTCSRKGVSATRQLEITKLPAPKTRYLPVLHTTTKAAGKGDNMARRRSYPSVASLITGIADRGIDHGKPPRCISPNASTSGKTKVHNYRRRFSFGKDTFVKSFEIINSDISPLTIGLSNRTPVDALLKDHHSDSAKRTQTKSYSANHPHELFRPPRIQQDQTDNNVTQARGQRPHSYSDGDEFNIVLQENTTEYSDDQGNAFIDIKQTTYRQRSNTLEDKDLSDTIPSQTYRVGHTPTLSSNAEFCNNRTPGFPDSTNSRANGLSDRSNSPEPTSGKSFVMRKYRTKDISDLFKKFTSDKEANLKDTGTSYHKKKSIFGKF